MVVINIILKDSSLGPSHNSCILPLHGYPYTWRFLHELKHYSVRGFTSFMVVVIAFVVVALADSVSLLGEDLVVVTSPCPAEPVWNSTHGLCGPQPAFVPHATVV